MKPTQEQVIAWIDEASGGRQPDGWGVMLDREQLERFAALAYEAGRSAATALRARLAQPEPEPVAWADKYDLDREGHDFWVSRQANVRTGVPLYTAPPQREWLGLTDEEFKWIVCKNHNPHTQSAKRIRQTIKEIEDTLKEKNT